MALGEQEQPRPQLPKPRPTRAALLERSPWLPVPYGIADVTALQALSRGEASPEMQRRALKWLIEQAAGTYEVSYRAGTEDGRRDTDFAEGRRFVGLQVVKLLHLIPGRLPRDNPDADPPEPRE